MGENGQNSPAEIKNSTNKQEKKMKNTTTLLIVVALLIAVGLGCSDSETKNADNKAANVNSNNSNTNSTANSNSSSPSNADVTGSYGITGENPSGQKYSGDLSIKKQGEVYQFSWNVAGSAYDGVGVRDGNLIAVGYGAGDNGKGCGAVIYKIGEKTLDGKMGGWGFNQVGKQTAILVKEDKKGGVFTVIGTDTDGSDYKGELYVTQGQADVYHFAFNSEGKVKYVGTGVKVGDYFAAGMGVKQCGYVVYEVKGDKLEAAWGVVGNDKLGTEIALRK